MYSKQFVYVSTWVWYQPLTGALKRKTACNEVMLIPRPPVAWLPHSTPISVKLQSATTQTQTHRSELPHLNIYHNYELKVLHNTGQQQDTPEESQWGSSVDGIAEARGLEPDQWPVAGFPLSNCIRAVGACDWTKKREPELRVKDRGPIAVNTCK